MGTVEKLDAISKLRASAVLLTSERDRLIAEAQAKIPTEILAEISDIKAEYDPKLEANESYQIRLLDAVQEEVLKGCQTVKGKYLMAVYNKGRVTWDTKVVEGLAMTIPELNSAKKVGAPYMTTREI